MRCSPGLYAEHYETAGVGTGSRQDWPCDAYRLTGFDRETRAQRRVRIQIQKRLPELFERLREATPELLEPERFEGARTVGDRKAACVDAIAHSRFRDARTLESDGNRTAG